MILFRIGANIQAMDSLRKLYGLNTEIATRQSRLASGRRINTARDDTAGYAIARSLEGRAHGLSAALSNVANAQSLLAIAEGGYQNQMDILQTIKDKTVQAADRAVSDGQRVSIDKQVYQLLQELDDIGEQTKWSDTSLINDTAMTTDRFFSFHVGGDTGEELKITLAKSNSDVFGLAAVATVNGTGTIGGSTAASTSTLVDGADTAIDTVTKAIDTLAGYIQTIGDSMVRLGKKNSFLSVSHANTEAVRSQYEDADFAVEQMELLKLQILQSTSVSALAQANTGPQVVLGLFR